MISIKLTAYRKFQLVFFSIIIIILIYYLNKTKKIKNEMWENARYTIATTTGTTQGLKSSLPSINFFYLVRGKKYSYSIDLSLEKHKINTEGGRYLLVYSNNNFEVCEFQYECAIPDSIKNAPDEGWLEPPFNCNVHENDKLLNIKGP